MKTLLERPEEGQTLELLKLFVKRRVTKKMAQRILENSPVWFKQELRSKLLLVAREETLSMKDGDEHNTCKILCLALIASATKSKDDIEAFKKAISSEEHPRLNCFILLASITKEPKDFGAIRGEAAYLDCFADEIKSFVWLAKITGDPGPYIEMARKKVLSLAKEAKTGSEDYYWIALAAIDIADFTKEEKDILFVRDCVLKMEKDDHFLKSSVMLGLFRTTRDKTDSGFARELISKIDHLDFKAKQSAKLAMLTKSSNDILLARQIIENDEESLCYIARATLNSSDIDRAYRVISGQTRLLMTSINEKDADRFDVLLSAAIEAKRFDVVEKLIIEASGYHRVRDCIRAYNKLASDIIN